VRPDRPHGLIDRLTAIIRWSTSVRARLCLIVAAILLPALAVAGWLTVHAAREQRDQIVANLQEKAREAATSVEREIVTTKNLLKVLSVSHFLQTGDIGSFRKQAAEISRQLGVSIDLRDPVRDQRLVDTAIPNDLESTQEFPQIRRELERRAEEAGKPVVSNVFYSPLIGQYIVSVVMPISRDGKTAYFLSIGTPTQRIADILDQDSAIPNTIIGVVDRNNVIVARNVRHWEYTGTPVTNEVNRQSVASEGSLTAVDRNGVSNSWFYRRLATGWLVSVGVPTASLQRPRTVAIATFSAAATLLFGLAMAITYHFGGRFAPAIGALGIDRKPTPEEFDILFDSAPNGVVVVDRNGVIVLANAQIEHASGYERGELIGQRAETLIPRLGHQGDSRWASGRIADLRLAAAGGDLFGRRRDGAHFPVEVRINPITTRDGEFTMVTVVDVTGRRVAARSLSDALAERDDLRRRLMQAYEEERLRLAHELHDQTGQSLTAVMLELKGLEPLVDEKGRQRLRMLRKQLDDMGKTLHHVAWELRPASIDELGLAAALENYICEWSAQSGIEADFHCRGGRMDEISDEIRTAIYRVVQESLTNVAKHAHDAATVSVVLDRTDTGLQLTIEDNGPGFDHAMDTGRERKNGGLGLAGMRERLSLIGGRLEVESSLGQGTTIFARIPLNVEKALT